MFFVSFVVFSNFVPIRAYYYVCYCVLLLISLFAYFSVGVRVKIFVQFWDIVLRVFSYYCNESSIDTFSFSFHTFYKLIYVKFQKFENVSLCWFSHVVLVFHLVVGMLMRERYEALLWQPMCILFSSKISLHSFVLLLSSSFVRLLIWLRLGMSNKYEIEFLLFVLFC